MKNIILTGLMGSGKTCVSQKLKEIFPKFNLVEIDSIIVEKEGKSINEIFLTNGETYFRTLEKNIIDEILKSENQIISLGGGSLENNFNFELSEKNSIIFYLKANAETLYERIKDCNDRPLLKDDNPKTKLETLLKVREKNYLKANYIIDVNYIGITETAKKIEELYINANRNN